MSGEGTISIFRICGHLIADDKNRILIIDEPELSLHPSAQKALSGVISQAAQDRQIIVCTHSPHFANWEGFLNGSKFVRLNKPNDNQCEISCLDNKKSYSNFIKNNHLEWQKPQLLDYVAKEILFLENLLFVEGQEDVGLIKRWLKKNPYDINFEIFGYGVASYANIRLFLEMAKDLGLRKVAALYDNGEDSRKAFTEDSKEYHEYDFQILPTPDIRDKHNVNDVILKEGCFDKAEI